MKRIVTNLKRESSKLVRRALAPPGVKELPPEFPEDFSPFTRTLWKRVKPYTMTSKERVFALESALRHVHRHSIEGDIVECGVDFVEQAEG